MRKFISVTELNNENLLTISRKWDYEVCTAFNDSDKLVLQDAGCLSSLLKDGGIIYIDNDKNYYYYSLKDIIFAVPYDNIAYDYEEDDFDQYLDFDSLFIIIQ